MREVTRLELKCRFYSRKSTEYQREYLISEFASEIFPSLVAPIHRAELILELTTLLSFLQTPINA
jgi:hypothetical protein